MPMFTSYPLVAVFALNAFSFGFAQDLHLKKDILVMGNKMSTSEAWIKGKRERTAINTAGASLVIVRQCDLQRTVTINDLSHSYAISNDARDDSGDKSTPAGTASVRGTTTQTVTVMDTGERKQMFGFPARHLKTTVTSEPSPESCSRASQSFEIDGWYADVANEQASCGQNLSPMPSIEKCSDRVVLRYKGTTRPGLPLSETITMHSGKASTQKIQLVTSEVSKEDLSAELFEVPPSYQEVKSVSELYPMPQMPTSVPIQGNGAFGALLNNGAKPINQAQSPLSAGIAGLASRLSGSAGKLGQAQVGMMQGLAPAQLQSSAGTMMPAQNPQMQNATSGSAAPLPQLPGPKAPGKIRIGVVPADAQLGQGNNPQADYGTPIRNTIVGLMAGPAVEVIALDARLPIQAQAEAGQKRCDYILFTSVAVKHSSSSFGKFMKMGSMAANVTPVGVLSKGMGGLIATQAAAQAANMSAHQQAINQLAQFNGQVKSKDDVNMDYHLIPTGQDKAKLENSLAAKAKSDGEDVMTPMIQQAANAILTEVTKK